MYVQILYKYLLHTGFKLNYLSLTIFNRKRDTMIYMISKSIGFFLFRNIFEQNLITEL